MTVLDESSLEISRRLRDQGFSKGLTKMLIEEIPYAVPVRYWIVDNSYSMSEYDGMKFRESKSRDQCDMVKCSRWEEIQQTVIYHARLAALLKTETHFQLLNDPGLLYSQRFSISGSSQHTGNDLLNVVEIMERSKPCGLTPLVQHLLEVHGNIKVIAPTLRNKGQKAVIVIATDGLPTSADGRMGQISNEEFANCLRLFQLLPVLIVIRLCTNDQKVVDFYNSLDQDVELQIEVIDDFQSEAIEIERHNKWLCYSLTLHRCREFGFHDPLFDAIDERALTIRELRFFIALLFDISYEDIPDPENHWTSFVDMIQKLQRDEMKQYNSRKRSMTTWIDLNELQKVFNPWFYYTLFILKVVLAVFSLFLLARPRSIIYKQ